LKETTLNQEKLKEKKFRVKTKKIIIVCNLDLLLFQSKIHLNFSLEIPILLQERLKNKVKASY